MKIYCLNNTIQYKKESYDRGCRDDVFVFDGEKYYRIIIYDRCRFIQDFDVEISELGCFVPEPNTLIVSSITDENIIHTITEAFNNGLFDCLSPCLQLSNNEIQYIINKDQCENYEKMGLPYKISKAKLIEMVAIN